MGARRRRRRRRRARRGAGPGAHHAGGRLHDRAPAPAQGPRPPAVGHCAAEGRAARPAPGRCALESSAPLAPALPQPMSSGIRIRGARQHNLKNLDLDIRTGEMTVVTGAQRIGQSRAWCSTRCTPRASGATSRPFSAYARQFLDRMDRPAVDRVDGVPPAIAIDQTNPVRSSRSTVGTMTELNDHLKLLFARAAQAVRLQTALPVRHDTPETIYAELLARTAAGRPAWWSSPSGRAAGQAPAPEQIEQWLSASGYTRVQGARGRRRRARARAARRGGRPLPRCSGTEKARVIEAIETALRRGSGRVNVYVSGTSGAEPSCGATRPACTARSDLRYADPQPALFSFNSAVGACETCRGFGRVIGVDYGLVIPDERRRCAGAIKPMQTPACYREIQDDLMNTPKRGRHPRDTPWNQLTEAPARLGDRGQPQLEGQLEQAVVRRPALLRLPGARPTRCTSACCLSVTAATRRAGLRGARLKPEALLWRLGSKARPMRRLEPSATIRRPAGVAWSRAQLEALPGLEPARPDAAADRPPAPLLRARRCRARCSTNQALKLLLDEIRTRLKYLCDVGLGYLTLDRQSRTLSGGEVQRINLTTALGTSLVNTMFVLDEPVDRPAPARHGPHRRGDAAPARRRQHAGGGRARPGGDARRRPPDRHGPRPRASAAGRSSSTARRRARAADTLTGRLPLAGKSASIGPRRVRWTVATPRLIRDRRAREHNLKASRSIPLQRLVCVTGVSARAIDADAGRAGAGAARAISANRPRRRRARRLLLGADWLTDVVFVDQSPIGKTARSNPASYVGALGRDPQAVRRRRRWRSSAATAPACSASTPATGAARPAAARASSTWRCSSSDVYLRCPDCDGRRYRAEILDAQDRPGLPGESRAAGRQRRRRAGTDRQRSGHSSATTARCCAWLQPIVDVGLEYVRLGQPVPTLSGGEAQRPEAGGFLAETAPRQPARPARAWREGGCSCSTADHRPALRRHRQADARLRKLLDAGALADRDRGTTST